MPKVMLVNVINEEESRIAITSDGLLEELAIETSSHEQIEGNIYKSKIVKILPSLEAVFVDYGGNRNGFLAFSDIHPKYFPEGQRGAEGLRKGQDLLVQVRKGEMGQKGAALTTFVSIPGRYIVLMPLVGKRGVSRKIQDDDVRKELKTLLQDSGIPEDMGYIVRTAGLEQTKQDLSRDVSYLMRLWKNIQSHYDKTKGCGLLYQESDIVIRTIRDYFTPGIQEVWIDNESIHEQVRSFFRAVMPWYQKKLNLYTEREPLFSKFKLEHQIASIYEKNVPLPSGGSIVIEQTEALVSIDVNSGKTNKGKDIEETALIANREAAEEAARQLRLRDLGGLIVLDFIDMRSSGHRNEVRKVLQKALKEDKARTDIGTISKFGMLELSRQRVKPAGLRLANTCPLCSGTGKIRSSESVALAVLRLIQAGLARGKKVSQVLVGLSAEVAVFLLNRKRRAILELEEDFATSITICAEPALQPNQYYLEFRENGGSRVETNLPEEFPRAALKAPAGLPGAVTRAPRPTAAYALLAEDEEEPKIEVPEEPPEEGAVEAPAAEAPERTGRKRKRRRKKKKGGAGAVEGAAAPEAPAEGEAEEEPEAPEEPEAEAPAPVTAPPAEGEPKKLSASAKRRARRRRKKGLAAQEHGAETVPSAPETIAPEAQPPAVEVPAPVVESAAPAAEEAAPGEPAPGKPKKAPRRRKRTSKPKAAETAAAEAAPIPAEAPAPAPPPVPAEAAPVAPTDETSAVAEGAPPKRKTRTGQRRRSRPKAAGKGEPAPEGSSGEGEAE